jgi:hypothetical protein
MILPERVLETVEGERFKNWKQSINIENSRNGVGVFTPLSPLSKSKQKPNIQKLNFSSSAHLKKSLTLKQSCVKENNFTNN